MVAIKMGVESYRRNKIMMWDAGEGGRGRVLIVRFARGEFPVLKVSWATRPYLREVHDAFDESVICCCLRRGVSARPCRHDPGAADS
jgi:hypothetical protein